MRRRVLADHSGSAADAATFAGAYLAGHFRDAIDYVRRPQRSLPDFSAYHGLESANGDRRAWTIEVRLFEYVDFASDDVLREIAVANENELARLPDDLVGRACAPGEPDEAGFDGFVAARIETLCMGAAA